ncbi:MAG: hypothetical protein ABW042_05310 [Phenylobacterium sp.]
MVDLFEEVEEQLRSDRYKVLALKALPWLLAALAAGLLLAGGVWGLRAYGQRANEQASMQYADGLEAFAAGRTQEADKLWAQVAQSKAKSYRALALMQRGGILLSQNKPAEAVKLFDEAAEAAPDPVIGDAARLKAAYTLMDTAPFATLQDRLAPLKAEDRPYRVLAEEALAFAKLQAGDLKGARGDFSALKDLLDAPEGVQQRADQAIDLIDSGAAKMLPDILKAARAAPSATPSAAPAPAPAAPAGAPSPSAPGNP